MISERTRALIVDPILADIDKEQREALRDGRKWRSRWILAAGSVALAKALAMHGSGRLLRARLDMAPDERRALGRTVAWALVLMTAMAAVLTIPPVLEGPPWRAASYRFPGRLLMTLVPQALPLAIPMGLTLGILAGLTGRSVSRASKKAILVMAAVCSMASFGTVGWVMPVANQAFRTAVFRAGGNSGAPMRGYNELTLTELNREIATASRFGAARQARLMSVNFHIRWALPFATVLMAALALSWVRVRCSTGRAMLTTMAFAAFAGYFLLANGGEYLVGRGSLSPFAGVWLPNLLLSFYLLVSTYRERRSVIKPAH